MYFKISYQYCFSQNNRVILRLFDCKYVNHVPTAIFMRCHICVLKYVTKYVPIQNKTIITFINTFIFTNGKKAYIESYEKVTTNYKLLNNYTMIIDDYANYTQDTIVSIFGNKQLHKKYQE